MKIGDKLTELREKRHLTQDQVAEALGVKRARYNAWENNISKPDIEMLSKIAKFHKVSVDLIIGNNTTQPELDVPEWANAKDKRDLKKMLENPGVLFYDGIEFSEEDKAKMQGVLETIFWEAKRMNKEAYKKGREKKDGKL